MLFVGDDWAEDHHDVEIVDESGRLLVRRRLPEGLEGVTRLHALVAEQMPEDWSTRPLLAGAQHSRRSFHRTALACHAVSGPGSTEATVRPCVNARRWWLSRRLRLSRVWPVT
jgi:hypothetical protein